MEIKVITNSNGEFVDVLRHDIDVELWANHWIKGTGKYWDIEMYNDGKIHVNDDSICFSGDNGMLQLNIINKIL